MKWHVIDKTNSLVPTKGGYRDWKSQLADEGRAQCVYCCIHESKFGGIRNFHVEHLRPQSTFPKLRDVYGNLFYACGICNVFKSDDWPAEPISGDFSFAHYPDPSLTDYGSFISLDLVSGLALSDTVAGRYIIERLYLNRPQIVALRVLENLFSQLRRDFEALRRLSREGALTESQSRSFSELAVARGDVLDKLCSVRPYAPDQIKRR